MAAGKKRVLEETSGNPKAKKSKTEEKPRDKAQPEPQHSSALVADDIDFPRGGGTSLTPLEVKTLRAEAAKEADKELFAVRLITQHICIPLTSFAGVCYCGGKTNKAQEKVRCARYDQEFDEGEQEGRDQDRASELQGTLDWTNTMYLLSTPSSEPLLE